MQLIEGAEAKAFYGLALNYKPLQALVERLLVKETLSGKEVAETLEGAGVHHFPDPYVEGFLWGDDGGLRYPGMPTQARRPLGPLQLSISWAQSWSTRTQTCVCLLDPECRKGSRYQTPLSRVMASASFLHRRPFLVDCELPRVMPRPR